MDIQSHQLGLPPGQETEEQQHWKSHAWFLELLGKWELLKYTLLLLSALWGAWPYIWLQASAVPAVQATESRTNCKEGLQGRVRRNWKEAGECRNLLEWGFQTLVLYPFCLYHSLLHNHWTQQDQKMKKLSMEGWMKLSMAIKVHGIRKESLATWCHKDEYWLYTSPGSFKLFLTLTMTHSYNMPQPPMHTLKEWNEHFNETVLPLTTWDALRFFL